MTTLKQAIKTLAAEQPLLKNQRKSVHIVGERTMTPYQAWSKHQDNRHTLRHMYIAYAILRGYSSSDVEEKSDTPFNMRFVEQLIEKYKPVVVQE